MTHMSPGKMKRWYATMSLAVSNVFRIPNEWDGMGWWSGGWHYHAVDVVKFHCFDLRRLGTWKWIGRQHESNRCENGADISPAEMWHMWHVYSIFLLCINSFKRTSLMEYTRWWTHRSVHTCRNMASRKGHNCAFYGLRVQLLKHILTLCWERTQQRVSGGLDTFAGITSFGNLGARFLLLIKHRVISPTSLRRGAPQES